VGGTLVHAGASGPDAGAHHGPDEAGTALRNRPGERGCDGGGNQGSQCPWYPASFLPLRLSISLSTMSVIGQHGKAIPTYLQAPLPSLCLTSVSLSRCVCLCPHANPPRLLTLGCTCPRCYRRGRWAPPCRSSCTTWPRQRMCWRPSRV